MAARRRKWSPTAVLEGATGLLVELHNRQRKRTNSLMPTLKASLTGFAIATFLLFHLAAVSPAFAWRDKGHRVVALIAEANFTQETRKRIQEILPAGTTLADAALWPDHEGRSIGDLNPLHYVSIADNAEGYDQARDCPERDCIVEALKWFLSNLSDRNAPTIIKRMALRYVAHLVGDIHQPLHAGRLEDRGGTLIKVSYRGQTTNLHYFWDTDLVEMEPGTPAELARRLGAAVTEEERLRWQSGGPVQWTDESLMLVRSRAYSVGQSVELSDEYVEMARPVVRTRLVQAGIRLAWLLNSAFR
ncbi:MAG: S1/P1 nuclease [Deltaproteobacteria bacterium]|nr:S1/P1 nuclease [Deltaproteobacteria bacterium]